MTTVSKPSTTKKNTRPDFFKYYLQQKKQKSKGSPATIDTSMGRIFFTLAPKSENECIFFSGRTLTHRKHPRCPSCDRTWLVSLRGWCSAAGRGCCSPDPSRTCSGGKQNIFCCQHQHFCHQRIVKKIPSRFWTIFLEQTKKSLGCHLKP